MRKYALFVVVFLVTVSMAAKKKPKVPDPVLCGIKTVFISGHSLAADQIRENWTRVTGIKVVVGRAQAAAQDVDAVMSVVQEWDTHITLDSSIPNQYNYVVKAAMVLNTNDGPVVWTFAGKDGILELINLEPDPTRLVNALYKDFMKKASCNSK